MTDIYDLLKESNSRGLTYHHDLIKDLFKIIAGPYFDKLDYIQEDYADWATLRFKNTRVWLIFYNRAMDKVVIRSRDKFSEISEISYKLLDVLHSPYLINEIQKLISDSLIEK